MNKKEIERKVEKIVNDILLSTEYQLVDVEYVKEGPFKYLRVYLDKPTGIDVEDCADVSRKLNKKLDELDLIKEQYFLEVSSPGIERAFKKEEDYQKNIGEVVEVRFYSPVDGKKSIVGILKEKNEDSILIELNNEEFNIDLKNISKTNRIVDDF